MYTRERKMTMKQRFFTLIELLIVISISAILTSILLPSLSKAREAGKKGLCQNNQKQIFIGALNYSIDFDDWIIPNYHTPPYGYWQHGMVGQGYLSGCWGAASLNLTVSKPIGIYKCPSENRVIAGGAANACSRQ